MNNLWSIHGNSCFKTATYRLKTATCKPKNGSFE